MRPYYLTRSGTIQRQDNSVIFDDGEQKKPIPINDVESLCVMQEVNFNSKFINFASQNKVPIHFFNYYGYYSGSFMPREYLNSGLVMVNQVQHYLNKGKRMNIAREIVDCAVHNILTNLQYYKNRDRNLSSHIETIKEWRDKIAQAQSPDELMGIEGNIRKHYYQAFPQIIQQPIEFDKRTRRPPENMLNALISYGNSLVYTTVLSQIYHTQLSPLVSFLHEPGSRRYSLALDIAEIFKPLLADRIIFKLLNSKQLTEKHFAQELNFCYLKDKGREIYLREYDSKLKKTIKHRKLDRHVSYKRIIRLECYKLTKLLTEAETYTGFKIWW